jgi:hypothetical protein
MQWKCHLQSRICMVTRSILNKKYGKIWKNIIFHQIIRSLEFKKKIRILFNLKIIKSNG